MVGSCGCECGEGWWEVAGFQDSRKLQLLGVFLADVWNLFWGQGFGQVECLIPLQEVPTHLAHIHTHTCTHTHMYMYKTSSITKMLHKQENTLMQ